MKRYFSIGIHTNGGCNPPNDVNFGTSFEHNPLENASQDFLGNNTIYIDNESVFPIETGTILQPFNTVQEGVNQVINGGELFIVTGTYNNNFGLSFDKNFILIPPVSGIVVLNT